MIKRWLIALLIAELFGAQAFADCVPSPDAPASVIEYFQKFNKPLPEQFCAKEDAAPQASEEPSQDPPQAYEDVPEPSPLDEPGGTMLSYPLSTSLFQSRCIPLLPMFATLNFAHIISGLSGSIRAWSRS
jgi:hypothetical protein